MLACFVVVVFAVVAVAAVVAAVAVVVNKHLPYNTQHTVISCLLRVALGMC